MYEYKIKIVRVVDGDTVDVDIDLGFGVWLRNQRVRLIGIDTPESRTRDLREKAAGIYTKKRLSQILEEREDLYLISKKLKRGKFGRILGDIGWTQDDRDMLVTDMLLIEKLAVEYQGQSKKDIAAQHAKNIDSLITSGTISL